MATNDMTIEQISAVVNEIFEQATGMKGIGNYSGNNFVTVAQTALKTGYDPIMKAISQVMSRTIFSIRNYSAKFRALRASNERYGNMVRKIKIADSKAQDNVSYSLQDGESVDQYKVALYNVLQTNFYGQVTWERQITTFENQLDTAFHSASEFGSFYSMELTNVNNQIEQTHETLGRGLVCNGIAAVLSENDTSRVYKCLTEYNNETGLALTQKDVYKPDNFPAFMVWLAARIERIKQLMTERSVKFQTNITDKEITQHTPYDRQQMYIYAPLQFDLANRVLSDLFNDDRVKLGYNELVSFWQSIDTPDTINMTPVYMDNTGAVKSASAPVNKNTVLGIIFDDDFTGYTIVNDRQRTSPYNAKGEYWNTFYKYNHRYWMDNTEKAVVLLLE